MHKAFRVHILNEKGKALASEIAGLFDDLLLSIEDLLPAGALDGREGALLVTHLEEANFYAKKVMASLEVNQADATATLVPPTRTPIGEDTRPDLPLEAPADPTAIVSTKGIDVSPKEAPHPSELFAAARKIAQSAAAATSDEPAARPAPPAAPPPRPAKAPRPEDLIRQARELQAKREA